MDNIYVDTGHLIIGDLVSGNDASLTTQQLLVCAKRWCGTISPGSSMLPPDMPFQVVEQFAIAARGVLAENRGVRGEFADLFKSIFDYGDRVGGPRLGRSHVTCSFDFTANREVVAFLEKDIPERDFKLSFGVCVDGQNDWDPPQSSGSICARAFAMLTSMDGSKCYEFLAIERSPDSDDTRVAMTVRLAPVNLVMGYVSQQMDAPVDNLLRTLSSAAKEHCVAPS